MQIINSIDKYSAENKSLFLALGNFDGVHKGHQRLIEAAVKEAFAGQGRAGAFIFEPHPVQVLNPEKAPRLLVSSQRKAYLLERLGLNSLINSPFTLEIAHWSPEQFVKRILVDRLQVKKVFVGFNHSFGYRGQGTPELLEQLGKEMGFAVNIIPPVKVDGEIVSSTRIRKALGIGDIAAAYNMLGYHPLMEGIIVEGEHRGTRMGFPTINVRVEANYQVIGQGVYAASARLGDKNYGCVVNIGTKPTFHQEHPLSIEAHLFGFSEIAYGEEVALTFISKLREEQKFNNMQELVAQISRDKEEAEQIINAFPGDF